MEKIIDEYSTKNFSDDILDARTTIQNIKEEQERVIKERKFEDCTREIRIASERILIAQHCYDALKEISKKDEISEEDAAAVKAHVNSIYASIVNSQYYLGIIAELPEVEIETPVHLNLKEILEENLSTTEEIINDITPYLEKYGYSMKGAPDGSQPGRED